MTNNNRNSAGNQGSPTMDGAMEQLFASGVKALSEADKRAERNGGEEKTVKLLGFIEVPETLATIADGLWNEGSHQFTSWLEPNTHKAATWLGSHAGLSGSKLNKSAAVATVAINAGLKGWPSIHQLFSGFREGHDAYRQLAMQIAPVLDDIKGKHSVGALTGVKEADNEVIYAQRKRIAAQAGVRNSNNVISMMVNLTPGVLSDVPAFRHMWTTGESHQLSQNAKAPSVSADDLAGRAQKMVGYVSRIGASPVANYIIHSNERKLRHQLQDFSAMEMILELQKQVEANPKESHFQLPKSILQPSRRADECGLEAYIGRILIQHQKDMADISPDHTELREALKDDIAAVAKPIAAAIREGHMSVLSLVRLVGEGKIIKNRGRAIIGADEVRDLIQHEAPKQAAYVHVDPKEYYTNTPYTKQQFKEILPHLEGEERQVIIGMTPDSVLEDAGMSKKEIKAVRDAQAAHYDQMIAESIMGLNAKTDADLAAEGMAKNEIKQLRSDAAKISHKGMDAVPDMKAGPANPMGVELLLTNWAVPQIMGKKAHLGTVLSAGREALADVANDGAYSVTGKPQGAVITGHGKQHQGRVAANEGHFQVQA